MTVGMSVATANGFLNALGRNVSYAKTATYARLHIGDPGAAGTANTATEATRQQVTFAAPVNGSMSNSAVVTWTSIAGSQTATHFSLWDAASGGNFLVSGVASINSYTAGQTVTVEIGAMTLVLAVAT